MKKLSEVTAYINIAPPQQEAILNTLRDLIAQRVPHAEEAFKWGRPVYLVGKIFCYLQANKKHVNLGFYYFRIIDDPNQLLEGTGKNLRHIKIRSLEEMDLEVLGKMIEQSAKI